MEENKQQMGKERKMSWKDKMTKDDEKWFNKHFNRKNQPIKHYKLTFNKEVLLSDVPYPVCRAKKSELIRTGSYNGMEHLLKIERDYSQIL